MGMGTVSTRTTTLTEQHKQIIDGMLLSDGSLYKFATPALTLTTIHKAFAEHFQTILPFSSRIDFTPASTRHRKDGKIISCKPLYFYKSHVDCSLHYFYNRWYNDKKVIPVNLVITPSVLLYWFLGDGFSLVYPGTQKLHTIGLSTNGFTLEENEHLSELLKVAHPNLKALVKPHMGSHRLMFTTQKAMGAFYDFVDSCPIECFLYKWKTLIIERPRFDQTLLPLIDNWYKDGLSYTAIQKRLRDQGIPGERHTIAKYHKRFIL